MLRGNLMSKQYHRDCHVHCRELAMTKDYCDPTGSVWVPWVISFSLTAPAYAGPHFSLLLKILKLPFAHGNNLFRVDCLGPGESYFFLFCRCSNEF